MISRKSILLPTLLAITLILPTTAPVAASESPFVSAMRQMMLFFTLMNGLSGSQEGLSNPYGMGMPPYSMHQWPQQGYGANPWSQAPIWQAQPFWGSAPPTEVPTPATQHLKKLQGRWFSGNGAMLAIREGLARLYFSTSEYQDYYVRANDTLITLRSSRDGSIGTYEYVLDELGLQLTNDTGGVITFRRMQRAPALNIPRGGGG